MTDDTTTSAPPEILRRIQRAIEVAMHATTPEGERDAAIGAIDRLCSRHGIDPEQFGIYFVVGDEEWENAKSFFDDGWGGQGWRPSDLATMGDSALSTSDMARDQRHPEMADMKRHQFRRSILVEARRRWRQGFYANPFAVTPKRRPDYQANSGDPA